MARALWKGHLKIEELSCAVALYAAASTSERVSFHTINRKTGHRVKRQYVDPETGKEVERDDQVKGYETSKDHFIILEPDEIAAAVPQSDKTLSVDSFVPFDEIDTVFLDKPYFITPADKHAQEVFSVIHKGMEAKKVAAIASAVLFRRERKLLIRPQGSGFVGNTLNFEYAVRSAEEAFKDVPDLSIKGEMLDLAEHIIETKSGKFDPAEFDDRYDAALAELVKAKMEGRKIEPPKRKRDEKVVSLLDALRESAKASGAKAPAASRRAAPNRRKTATAERRKAS